jgi:hypothetical protein
MKARPFLSLLALLLALLLLAGPALAQGSAIVNPGGYTLNAWVAAGGGGSAQAGAYTLGGTLGQAEAAPALAGGPYSLSGGFWPAAFTGWQAYVPVTRK